MAQTESKQTPTTVEQVPPAEQEPAAPVATPSQRFTNLVISEFGAATANPIQLNNNQKRLVQGYFIIIDRLLKEAESKRLAKNESNTNHQYDNIIPYDWQHVNMADLALDAVHAARMGLDMQEEAHLYPIPFANKKKGCYDIAFMEGYAGKQYKAVKYALVPPKAVTIEVVYSTDNFKAIKKSRTNPYDTYEFEITQPFNRGDIVGGFGYIEYDDPYKNELVILTLNDIKKRAQKGSAEFWGTEMTGKKVQVWENGNKTWSNAEGWLDEMVRKTIVREVYSKKHIPIDPAKLDDDFQHFKEREVVYAQAEIDGEANENANTTPIDIPQPVPQKLPPAPAPIEQPAPAQTEPQPIAQEPPEFYSAPDEAYEVPDF